jgi:hypothetical protein
MALSHADVGRRGRRSSTLRRDGPAAVRCPKLRLYAGIRAPTGVEVRATPETHGYQISFRRPAPIPIPAFLSSRPAEPESFVTAVTAGRCASDPHAFGRLFWNVKPGEPQLERVRLQPGTYCVAVWAVDSFTRPSPQPARLWIRIV